LVINKKSKKACGLKLKLMSTLGKISWWRNQLLVGKLSIQDNPSHLQPPACMDFQMAMHEPYPCSYDQYIIIIIYKELSLLAMLKSIAVHR
jgi:hypothetical protein